MSSKFTLKLFYSYSHEDKAKREKMKQSLAMLVRDDFLVEWSDQNISPGQNISEKIKKRMASTDIFVFLMSWNFLGSEPCNNEWLEAIKIVNEKSCVRLIPIILEDCAWQDLEGMDKLYAKALPEDGMPINKFSREGTAWKQIYEGLKKVTEELRKNFTLKDEFRKEIEKTKFISQTYINLQDIFVFPTLCPYTLTTNNDKRLNMNIIKSKSELLSLSRLLLIHGEMLSGKSALCRYLFLSLNDDSNPVMYVDLETVNKKPSADVFRNLYQKQFHGDYSLWEKESDKTVIFDNLSEKEKAIEYVLWAQAHFKRVIVTLPSDTFFAYFKDEDQLAEFKVVKIDQLTHDKQENLIRNRAKLFADGKLIKDSQIDQLENQVNTVITENRILPRYPFCILSILQTSEGFMHGDVNITSQGHCYKVLITAHLAKSGIKADGKINTCFNFLGSLAFRIYQTNFKGGSVDNAFFDRFINGYKKEFHFADSILNRLLHEHYGLIMDEGQFRDLYTYHYFLGKYLAKNNEDKECKDIIKRMLNHNHTTPNNLTLMFIIHHTDNIEVVEGILSQTISALRDIKPSKLTKEETKELEKMIGCIPSNLIKDAKDVRSERKKERQVKQAIDDSQKLLDSSTVPEDEGNDEPGMDRVNDIYKIMKGNQILGQILSNKYGDMKRTKVTEIIEAIMDGGLRLVQLLLMNQEKLDSIAQFIHEKHPKLDNIEEIKESLRFALFLWTIMQIEEVVRVLNKPGVEPLVEEVVEKKKTPAYELIGYRLKLGTTVKFSDREIECLEQLLKKYRYPFMKGIVSLMTQRYLITHKTDVSDEQKACRLLDIKYKYRQKLVSLE